MSRKPYRKRCPRYASSSSSSSGDDDRHLFSESSEESLGLSQKQESASLDTVGSNAMNHSLNSLAGLPLMGFAAPIATSTASTTTTTTTTNEASPLYSLEEALPLMRENVQKYESRIAATNTTTASTSTSRPLGKLVNANTLPAQQQSQVRSKNTLDLADGFTPLSALSQEKQQVLRDRQQQQVKGLTHVSALSTNQMEQVRSNSVISSENTTTNASVSKIVDNSDSILRSRALFEMKFAQGLSDETVRAAFLGKPLGAFGALENNSNTTTASSTTTTTKMDCHYGTPHGEQVMGHLKKHHPHYCKLLSEHGGLKKYVCDLMHRPEKDYLIIVPTRKFLETYNIAGDHGRVLELVGSHLAIMECKDRAPVIYNLKNRDLYAYPTILKDRRISLRRINDELIEVNSGWLARRDEGGHGHVYVMQEGRVQSVGKRGPDNQSALTQEASLIELSPEAKGELDFVRVEEVSPEMSRGGGRLGTETMQPVGYTGSYRQPKLSVLLSKMLNSDYSATRDMSTYMRLGAPQQQGSNGGTTSSSPQMSDVFIKMYSVDDIYNRYLQNDLSNGTEYLSLIDAHQIPVAQSQLIDLGANLTLHEYRVQTDAAEISKSTLVNHVAVLSFTRDNQLCMTSFRVHDENFSRGVYISPSEAVVLRFKNNVLDTVTLNHASPGFATLPYNAEEEEMGGGGGNLNDGVTMRLEMDQKLSTQLEARELVFEQFANLVVPLCAPSFLKRAKAAIKGAIQPTVALMVEQSPLNLGGDQKVGPEVTKRVMVMIGTNAVTAAKNKRSYTFQRQTWRNTGNASEHIDVYTMEGVNRSPFSFATLVDKKGRSNVMSLTVADPITQRDRQVVFKLSNTKNVIGNPYWQGATRNGLHFHFELDQNGNLERFAIEYVKTSGTARTRTLPPPQDAPPQLPRDASRDAPRDVPREAQPDVPDGTSALTQFLCDEAYRLQEIGVPVGHEYLQARLELLLKNARPNDTAQAQKFFDALDTHYTHTVRDFKVESATRAFTSSLSAECKDRLVQHKYIAPSGDVCTRCATAFREDFARLDAQQVMQQVVAFTRAQGLTTGERDLFYSRFSCVLQQVASALRK